VAVAGDGHVEGELEDPDLAELLGQITHERIDRGLVGVAERLQRPLPVLGTVGGGDHPDPEVARLDLRVVAVLQQPDPADRAAGETRPDLVVKLALDDIKHVPVHRGLPR
jgi:hypothetical protein